MNNRYLMIRVCELYYIQNKSRKEVSAILGISRPQVYRLIIAAEETGIVNISIPNPYVRETELGNRLIECFGIRDALVADSTYREGESKMQSFAEEASRLVEGYIPQDARVGIISGHTCKTMIDAMEQSPKRLKLVVPLASGMSTTDMSVHVDTLTQELADLHGTSALNLDVPAVVLDLNLAVSLREEEFITEVPEIGKRVNITLVGISDLSEGATNIQLGSLKKQDVGGPRRQGAAASMCSSYLGKDGCKVGQETLECSIGRSLKDLKKSRTIAATIGDSKVEAIKAALKSDRIDILVADLETTK